MPDQVRHDDLRAFYETISIQISNKIKRQLFGILNFGHCDLFGFCDLLFGIFLESKPESADETSETLHLLQHNVR
jgi:hypothetical protein